MSELSLDQTPQGWDAVVEEYERVLEPLTTQFAEDTIRLADLKPGERVLDVAAGTGALTLAAAKAGADVVATDFSPLMIERLRTRITKDQLSNATAEVMDGQALTLPDHSFDAAFSILGLIFFPDRVKGFKEMFRVLKPGGRAAVVAWGSRGFRCSQFLRRAIENAVPNFPPVKPPPGTDLQDPIKLESEMRSAGFKQVTVHTISRTWTTPSPQWVWDHAMGHSPVVKDILRKLEQWGPENTEATGRAFVKILQDGFGSGPLLLEREAHIGIGVK